MSDEEEDPYDDREDEVGNESAGSAAEHEDEGAEEAEEEEEPGGPDAPLTREIVEECISLLCKTGDGLAHAYVRLDVKERDLTDINLLSNYIHLRYLDFTNNKLKDLSPVNFLPHCLTLKADANQLSNVELQSLPFLQTASFVQNKITSTKGFNHPLLEQLNLNHNAIENVTDLSPSVLTRLHTLELRANRLKTTAGINLPNLKNLFLAENGISRIEGLERLQHLAILHLRDNKIESLDGFSDTMRNLQYINLRGNKVSKQAEVRKLAVLPTLRALVMSENPVSDEDDYRLEVLISLRQLERLDKTHYIEEERQEALDIHEQRKLEEQGAEGAQDVVASEDEGGDDDDD